MNDTLALRLTLIGKIDERVAQVIFDRIRLKSVNTVNSPKLGNLSTMTYILEVNPIELISVRKEIMSAAKEFGLISLIDYSNQLNLYLFQRKAVFC